MSEQSPIIVKDSIATDATWQTVRVVLIFGCGAALSQFIHSETVVAAGVAAATAVLAYGYGLWKARKTHRALRFLARLVPDEIAQVKQ